MHHLRRSDRGTRRTVLVAAAALTWACGGSVMSTQGSAGAGGSGAGGSGSAPNSYLCAGQPMEVPSQHRAASNACPTDPQDTNCDGGLGAGCGPHCASDSDCSSNDVCTCDGTAFGYAHQSLGNVCVPSNCRTDADCASGYCSPSPDFQMGPFYGVQGYYCHSCADSCINDSDCPTNGYCAYDPTVGHWACSLSRAAG